MEIVMNTNNLKTGELATRYELPASTISTIMKDKEKILAHFNENKSSTTKRIRQSNYAEIEDAVMSWYNSAMKMKVPIDGPIVQAQALKYATMLKQTEFKASSGWLDGFKKRQQLSWKSIVGQAGLVDTDVTENYVNRVLPKLIENYEAKDIFNADETALFYKATPEKTLYYKQLPANHVKTEKERLSMLFCANMDGSEKLKPVLIGKAANPRCFKANNVNKANLPVYYRSNQSAWMTDEIFREWLTKIDHQFKAQNRKILLFLDNFSGHCDATKSKKTPIQLSNVNLIFFPPNCTSVLQPMDQGIIQSFKMKYRRAVVEEKVQAIEYGYEMPGIDVLSAIKKVDASWKSVTCATIRNCFEKAGFTKTGDDVVDTAAEQDVDLEATQSKWSACQQFQAIDLDQFMFIDSNLLSRGTLTDEQIVNSVAGARVEETNEQDDDSEDNGIVPSKPKITGKQARELVDQLRLYALQTDSDSSTLMRHLDECSRFIEKDSANNAKQSTLDMFFF